MGQNEWSEAAPTAFSVCRTDLLLPAPGHPNPCSLLEPRLQGPASCFSICSSALSHYLLVITISTLPSRIPRCLSCWRHLHQLNYWWKKCHSSLLSWYLGVTSCVSRGLSDSKAVTPHLLLMLLSNSWIFISCFFKPKTCDSHDLGWHINKGLIIEMGIKEETALVVALDLM